MKTTTSRWFPLAVAATLVLAACGSDDPDTADEPVPTVVDDGSGLRSPTPIRIERGSGSQSGAALEASSDVAADAAIGDAATSDMMIAPVPFITDFVVGDGMPALPANDRGYVYDATATVSAEQVQELAAALGVDGEAVRIDEGYGVSWRVGPDDGSAPSVWVYEDAQLSWNYNGPWRDGTAVAGCAVSIDSDGNTTEECDRPEPPIGVPTEAEAEAMAGELLAGLGVDTTGLTYETFADEWFANVNVMGDLDVATGARTWSFGFGAEGALQHANGRLATPEPVGPYPLVDLDTAIARLSDSWFGGYGGFGGIATDIAIGAPAIEPAIAEAPPVDPEIDGDVDGDFADDETMPVVPVEPEPVTVTLVDVEPDLWWAWDVDGSVWLLPAYRFIDSDGGWYVVPAVTDEFMIQVEPDIGEPLPAPEPMPAPEPVEPQPAPDEPDQGESVPGFDPDEDPDEVAVVDAPEPIDVEPAPGDPDAAVVELNELLPMPLEEFSVEAGARGFSTRVVVEDGEGYAITEDFLDTRVNVAVDDGIVVAIEFVG